MGGKLPTQSPRPVELWDYLAVVGGALCLFCTVGMVNAFGVFQEFYKSDLLSNKSEFDISWIGSLAIFSLYALAPFSGILTDKFGPRFLLAGGSLGILLSMFMTSLCTELYQFVLAQGILFGTSMSFVVWPPAAIVSRRMPEHRGLVLGIIIGASSLGGIIWPIMLDQLLYHHKSLGFGWTMRIVGFIMLPLLTMACATVSERAKPQPNTVSFSSTTRGESPETVEEAQETERPSNNTLGSAEAVEAGLAQQQPRNSPPSLLKNPVFLLLAAALALGYFGMFNPFFYIAPYAAVHGMSRQLSFYTISFINVSSLFGRVLAGHLADAYGHFNLITLAMFFSGITCFCWTTVESVTGLVIFSLAYGFSSGAIMSLQSACAGKIATPETQGKAIGMLWGFLAVTALVGSPIGGQLSEHFGYLALSMWTGATMFLGSIILCVARLRLNRRLRAFV